MDRNSFSYVLLVISSLASFLHLSWMAYNEKFTFSIIGMIFIILYGLVSLSEYTPPEEPEEDIEIAERPSYVTDGPSYHNRQSAVSGPHGRGSLYIQYRQFSASRHHHLSSHRFRVDDLQPICNDDLNDLSATSKSMEFTILEFCAFLLSTSFFTTDLFFAYQIFATEMNYLPLLAGLFNIIPALYMGSAKRAHELYIFTIPANCWGQVYYAGYKQQNIYAMLAGYMFFVAYYYNDVQRTFKGLTPQAQSNYYMSSYCGFASMALQTAFAKFDIKLLK